MDIALSVLAVLLFGFSVLVANALAQLPLTELRRRARAGKDTSLYRLATYGKAAGLALGIIGALSFALFIIRLDQWWQIILASVIAIWLVSGWVGSRQQSNMTRRVANLLAGWLASVLGRLPIRPELNATQSHTRLYDKEDLLDLLTHQVSQDDSRIPEAELKAAAAILNFGNKKVANAMQPIAKVKLVAEADIIVPHLLDELHKAKTDSFVVVKDNSKSAKLKPTGTLYLEEALEHPDGSLVKNVMREGIDSVDEDLPLVQALEFFLEKKYHTAVVMNGFDEIVGVLSMQNILEQILGARPEPSRKKEEKDDKITLDESKSSKQ